MSLNVYMLSGAGIVEIHFRDRKTGAVWNLTEDTEGHCERGGGALSYYKFWGITLRDARKLRDDLTRAIILAELATSEVFTSTTEGTTESTTESAPPAQETETSP